MKHLKTLRCIPMVALVLVSALTPCLAVTNQIPTSVPSVVATKGMGTKAVTTTSPLTSLLSAFVGAIFGATVAYFSDWLKERRKVRNEQHGAIVRTQMALVGQLNTLNNLRRQYLDPLRNDAERALKMIEFDMQDADLRVAYDSISFLLTTNSVNLVLEVHAAEQSYFSAMGALASRNDSYHKLHANSHLDAFDPETGRCVLSKTDPRHIKLIKDRTNALYTTVDSAVGRLTTQIAELENAGRLLFPKRKFLKVAGEK